MLRAMGGAGINTRDNPANIIDYVPVQVSRPFPSSQAVI